MTNKLKTLYKHLVDNRKHELKGWHDSYKQFYNEVIDIRQRINDGEDLSEHHKPFLRRLLCDKENGIASRGQSVLSEEHFNSFIQSGDFLSALSNFIVNPKIKEFEQFQKAWEDQGKSNNPLLINRVAAASTLDLSTTVSSWRFEHIFSWLIEEKLININNAPVELKGWFDKNQFVLSEFKREFEEELKTKNTDEFYLSIFVWQLHIYVKLYQSFKLEKQIIKYGPPGTGKTYLALQQSEEVFNFWKNEFAPKSEHTYEDHKVLVQFHPSFSYEDFIEGLRPILNEHGESQLILQNGIFKDFCQKAGKWEIDIYKLLNKNNAEKKWEELTVEDLRHYKKELTAPHWNHILEIQDPNKLVADAVPPFFFIIDEINRADLSRVFGELMYCLEYRGVKGCIKTQYANLNNENTCLLNDEAQGYKFFIPTNVYLMGTMNNIDRSIESFDFALRRRFRWEPMTPDYVVLEYYLSEHHNEWVMLADNLKSLNEKISKEALLGLDYQIGHAYLMNLKYQTRLKIDDVRLQIWNDRLRPLFQEYLRGTGRSEELMKDFESAFEIQPSSSTQT